MATTATFPLAPPAAGTPASQGGQVPERPYDDSRKLSIRRAPTKAEVLEIIERVTPPSYHEPILNDPRGSVAIYRQMACQHAVLQAKMFRSQQASFYLPYPTQGGPPASSANVATFEVVLRRTRDLDQGRIIEIGALDMVADQGRTYTNAERVEWVPFDTEPVKAVTMIAEVPGYFPNLDHLGDPDTGLLENPQTGEPATFLLDLAVQGGRESGEASILNIPGSLSQLQDSGRPDQFLATDVGLYVEIVASSVPANVGRVLKITAFEDPELETPPTSGLFPHFVTVDDGPQRTPINSAQADDGGVFTDESIAARTQTADDMTLLPATAAVGDAYYFGLALEFEFLEVDITTPGTGDWVLVWEYWNGASWVALSNVADESNGFKVSGPQRIAFDAPVGWATTAVNGRTAYYVRARVDSVTTTTVQPLGRFASMFRSDPLVADPGGLTWRIVDWIDLGFEVVQMTAPSGGTDDMLRLLGEERGVYQQSDETDDQFRQRAARLADSVSPNAISRAVNRELAPYGFRGLVLDVGNGFDGLFCDVDAMDYAFWENEFKVLLSNQEAYGWFFVFVPVLQDGTEFGFGWDFSLESEIDGVQIAPAWDIGIYDGEVRSADAIYRSIYDAVDSRRAGGIGFTMIRTEDLNFDDCNQVPPS